MLYNTRGVSKRTQEEKELPGRFWVIHGWN